MHVTKKQESPNVIILTIKASQKELESLKKHTLGHFAERLKLPGFRQGKAPLSVVEKHADPNQLQAEFAEEAINHLYQKTINAENIRPIDHPKVSLQKFVPYTELEFSAEVEVLSPVELPNYKQIRKQPIKISVTEKDIKQVLDSMSMQAAKRIEADRPAKKGDEVIIDFSGVDEKKQPVNGADAKDYPLMLGSNNFIPGFEDNLIGLKPGEQKTFTLTFPKDYSVKALANKDVAFTVTVHKINELQKPAIDDSFAKQAGPFKTLAELKDGIKQQLTSEKQNEADIKLRNELVAEIVEKSKLTVPERLINEQIDRLKTEVRQNLMYRGQTWQEMLDTEGVKEDEFIAKELRPEAERRVKTGLVLAEISQQEKIDVSPEEVDQQIAGLKAQYNDQAMQTELDKPEAKQDIASRLITDKTVNKLVELAVKTR